MSGHSRSQSDTSIDVDELLQIGSRCRQLRKEKELLKESQPQSLGLIRRLERHVTSMSTGRLEDKKRIEILEKELSNCSQEIDHLQDQLNAREMEVNILEEQVKSLEIRLEDTQVLKEELKRSDSECLFFMQELENREVELQNLCLCIEKLRDSISSMSLDSQCEIESLKLDIVALEQNCIEAEKIRDEAARERDGMNRLIVELEARFEESREIIGSLEMENEELREKVAISETKFRAFWQRLEKWLEKDGSLPNLKLLVNELENKLSMTKEIRSTGEALSPLIAKLETILSPDGDLVEKMSKQLQESELVVKKLKDELREEKLKAQEEMEDLAQEMAELRYQMMNLLEEERKRRACVEQASLQRIAELEGKVKREVRESLDIVKNFDGA